MLRLSQLLPKASNSRALKVETDVTPLAVLEFQSPTAAIIATPTPFMASYTNWFVSALVMSLILVGSTMKIDRLVTATGELVSTEPNSSIQAFSATSIVQDIKVDAGEIVSKGQVLA
ncbi:MAG TPA: HlyD family type I secretion periplasmic adaptor subunit, partial [Acidocella sp.]|nr:HlyD family type I secretion periplasmic adaptor subunit [Acidocella sp.]